MTAKAALAVIAATLTIAACSDDPAPDTSGQTTNPPTQSIPPGTTPEPTTTTTTTATTPTPTTTTTTTTPVTLTRFRGHLILGRTQEKGGPDGSSSEVPRGVPS
jgi:hypothetical protein